MPTDMVQGTSDQMHLDAISVLVFVPFPPPIYLWWETAFSLETTIFNGLYFLVMHDEVYAHHQTQFFFWPIFTFPTFFGFRRFSFLGEFGDS